MQKFVGAALAISAIAAAFVYAHSYPLSSRSPKNSTLQSFVIVATHHKSGTAFAFTTLHALSQKVPYQFEFGVLGPELPGQHREPPATLYTNRYKGKGTPAEEWMRTAIARPLADVLNLYEHRDANRFVHLVRNPIEMIVSAYLYHLRKPKGEMWWLEAPGLFPPSKHVRSALVEARCPHSNDPEYMWSWLEILECLPAESGIVAEGWKMIENDIEPMAKIASFIDCKQSNISLKLDIDEFTYRFGDSMLRLFSFLGVPSHTHQALLAELNEVQHSSRLNASKARHITQGVSEKEFLRVFLHQDQQMSSKLEQMRRLLNCEV